MPIMVDETLRRFGYRHDSLSPRSHKKIWCKCDNCEEEFPRIPEKITTPLLCKRCWREAQPPEYWQEKAKKRQETNLKKYGALRKPQSEETAAKRLVTMRAKFGGNSPLCDPAVREKVKETIKSRLGVEHALQSPEIMDKRSKTMREKYGAEYTLTSRELKEKVKRTVLDRYGTHTTALVPEVRAKQEATNLDRYGGTSPFNSKSVQEKSKATLIERLGVPYAQMHPDVRKKTIQTNIKRYGKEHALQNPEYLAKAIATRLETYGTLSPQWYGEAERELADFVKTLAGVKTTHILPTGKTLDILADNKLGIEYNGLRWHNELSPQPRLRRYHYDKWLTAKNCNIHLLTIFEDEWLTRRVQIEGYITAQLGKFTSRIYARSCKVKPIDLVAAEVFLEENHILGATKRSTNAWALTHQDAIVAVVTTGPHPDRSIAKAAVLDRLVFLGGLQIVGGAGRLVSAVKTWAKTAGHDKVISWSDNRWSTGKVYEKTGFTLAEEIGPRYDWVNYKNPTVRISRQAQRSQRRKCTCQLPIVDCAREHFGLARIWDCGKKRWEIRL